jgi:hypothetical protein
VDIRKKSAFHVRLNAQIAVPSFYISSLVSTYHCVYFLFHTPISSLFFPSYLPSFLFSVAEFWVEGKGVAGKDERKS